jgi:hypothetical protein
MSKKVACAATMVVWFLCIAESAFGRTYYIDFDRGADGNHGTTRKSAWKRCPGMVGFAGRYRHTPGDRFVFKGGCTWPASVLPLTIQESGVSGAVDRFGTDHAWFTGATWSRPVLAGEHSQKQLLCANAKSFFVVDDIAFVDFGSAGLWNGGKAIDICACSHYTLTRCNVAPQAWIGMYLHSFSGASEEDILIDGNDISASGQAIVVAVEAPGTVMRRVTISGNVIHDLSSQIVGATHGDGIHTWNSVQNDRSQFICDLTIKDNRFYGDFSCGDGGNASMTALIYLTDPGRRAMIYGNELTYSATTRFASLIWVRFFDSVAVFNNTLVLNGKKGGIGIIAGQGDPGKRVWIKNNIIYGAKYCYYIYEDARPTTVIDNNDCLSTGPAMAFWGAMGMTWYEWRRAGNDRKGIRADPEFHGPDDFRLRASSPCLNRAERLEDVPFLTPEAVNKWRHIGAREQSE